MPRRGGDSAPRPAAEPAERRHRRNEGPEQTASSVIGLYGGLQLRLDEAGVRGTGPEEFRVGTVADEGAVVEDK